jgi:glutamyl-tRNA synthetase
MNWTDPKTGELSEGFREKGFLPQAFVNLLAMLGWNDEKKDFFKSFARSLASISNWDAETMERLFKQSAESAGIKPGELQLPLRIMLVGGKFGPPVFQIAQVLGKEESIDRIEKALPAFIR